MVFSTVLSTFLAFLLVLLLCLARGWYVGWALLTGVVLFFALGLRQGYTAAELCRMAAQKARTSFVAIAALLLMGAITGLWRASGTITYCIHHGMRLIRPPLFLLLAFLICAVFSYVLGTSFGVASTAGVVLIALARFGGVSELVAGGAVLSGAFFGDRGSPASSSAILVASITGTELYANVKKMFATGFLPLMLSAALYAVLSPRHPLQAVDPMVAGAVERAAVLSWTALLPAFLMLVLPLLHVSIRLAMVSSIAAAAGVAVFVQHLSLAQVLRAALLGCQAEGELAAVLSGGGVRSMLSTCLVVLLTGLYSGLLEGTRVLEPLQGRTLALGRRLGRFPAAIFTGLGAAMVFCNQTVAVMLSEQLLRAGYADRSELALDIENSGVLLPALVPWSIASSVPLAMLGVGPGALPWAVLLWLTPLTYLLTKRRFFPGETAERQEPCDTSVGPPTDRGI